VNAERLHAIARELKDDFEATELPSLLAQLSSSLNALAQNPGDTDSQQQVATMRQQLSERLASSRTNAFSDSWRLALEELDIWDLLGDRLRDRIEDIFRRHEITPSTAASEIEEINTRLQNVMASIDNLISAFDALSIGAEELAPGEFEIGFLIPREAVDNELEQLGQEFERLDETLVPFMELTGEGRPDLEVRSISSSEFYVFLAALPGLALTMSKIVESLLSSYEKIKGIRDKASSLEDEDVPLDVIEGLRKHANERMEIDIDALAGELVGQATAQLPEGRTYELKMDVKRSVTRLAKRIDEGYSIEVRAFVPPEDEDEEAPEGVTDDIVQTARAITERQPRMRRMNLTGRPILELPEGDDGEEPPPSDEEEPPASPAAGKGTKRARRKRKPPDAA
jgi:hypothetical protein